MSIEVCVGRFTDEEGPPVSPGWAKAVRKQIVQAITLQTGAKPRWREGRPRDGEESLPLGGQNNLTNLQRYAAYLQWVGSPPVAPVPEDAPIEDLYEDPYLLRYWEAMQEEDAGRTAEWDFRHLLWTGAAATFYLPLDFPEPLLLEEEPDIAQDEGEPDHYSVGSAPRLLQELARINLWLQVPGDYGDLGAEAAWAIYEDTCDPWHLTKWAWVVLHWMARQACDRKLTMYFA